jgi:DNA-binding MarR family transcriptional regulator
MNWTFLTNHGHVLIILSRNAGIRISELADEVGISERQVSNILKDLYDSGYVTTLCNKLRCSFETPIQSGSHRE